MNRENTVSISPTNTTTIGDESRPAESVDRRNAPAPLKWTRNDTNFWLDAGLLVAFLSVLGITAIAQYVFPVARETVGWSLWGMDFDGWRTAQSVSIGVFALLVLIHLILHWAWVVGIIGARLSRHLGRRIRIVEPMTTLYGVAFLTFCLFALGAAVMMAEIFVVEAAVAVH